MLISTGYRHHELFQEEIARIPNPYGLSRDVLVKKFLFDRDRAQRNSTARLKAQTEQGGGTLLTLRQSMMPLEIAVRHGLESSESVGVFDELEDALTKFNELINRRNWDQRVTTISLTDTDQNKCLAQYALQEFNHSES